MGGPPGGSGAYAIRALPDLSRGIVSRRLGVGSFFPWTFLLMVTPGSPARPGLSLSLCVSAGTEPAAGHCVGQMAMTHPDSALWQVLARRSAWRRAGAPTRRRISTMSEAIEALAEAWASLDGKLDEFLAGRGGEDTEGDYHGYQPSDVADFGTRP